MIWRRMSLIHPNSPTSYPALWSLHPGLTSLRTLPHSLSLAVRSFIPLLSSPHSPPGNAGTVSLYSFNRSAPQCIRLWKLWERKTFIIPPVDVWVHISPQPYHQPLIPRPASVGFRARDLSIYPIHLSSYSKSRDSSHSHGQTAGLWYYCTKIQRTGTSEHFQHQSRGKTQKSGPL